MDSALDQDQVYACSKFHGFNFVLEHLTQRKFATLVTDPGIGSVPFSRADYFLYLGKPKHATTQMKHDLCR